MSAQRSPGTVDARSIRFDQTVMALGVLFGFVFDLPVLIPVLTAEEAAGAALGDGAPIPRLWHGMVAPRLRLRAAVPEAAGPWRAAFALNTALLGTGTAALMIVGPGLAWVVALPAAALGALAGVGRLCVGCQLHAWWSDQ